MTRLATLLLSLLMLAGCTADEGTDGPVDITLYTLATYTAPDMFTFDAGTHRAVNASGRDLEDGCRALIGYLPLADGTITLHGCTVIPSGVAQTLPPGEYGAVESLPIWVESLWREDRWLNMRARLPQYDVSDEPQTLALIVDQSTLQQPVVRARLVNQLPVGVPPADTYPAQAYASFDISALTGARTLEVTVDNANLIGKGVFTFPLADE